LLDRTSIGGGSTTAVLSNPGANDPELRTVIVFLIAVLRSLFADSHVLHQRSVKTIMKHHFKDLAELASKLTILNPNEDRYIFPKAPVETILSDITPMTLPLYILCQGCVTVWKLKPGGTTATEGSI
jgi:hypothetical protein